MKYILEKESQKYDLMGGKAKALAKLGEVLDNIPNWFVVTYEGFDGECNQIRQETILEIEEMLSKYDDNVYFAVRSSAANEDSSDKSFAGQLETYLYISKTEVVEKVLEVYKSAFSERMQVYKKENNINEICIPSVIVQEMIDSEMSGVAFGANPITNNIKEVLVSAVYGLGSGLVDGIATADNYTCNNETILEKVVMTKDFYHKVENRQVVEARVSEELQEKVVLEDWQIIEIVNLLKEAQRYFGRFQDIEWAYSKGKLYLLQSRPITTLGTTPNKNEKINVFDNSNIVESYGGITTPLTFSYIRNVYEQVYKELAKIFNVKQEKIEMNEELFKKMLALINGRVYYNLHGWYGLLGLLPGMNSNKKFMESMMGVKEELPDDLFPVVQKTFKDKVAMISIAGGMLKSFANIKKTTKKFYARLDEALEKKDIENMDLYELHDYYVEIQKKLVNKWDAPLVNDFLAMIFYGQLRNICEEMFEDNVDRIHNDLLCSEGGIISSQPAKLIKEMAYMIRDNDTLISVLESGNIALIKKEVKQHLEFNQKLNEYLEKFADRCLEELKLETLNLKENPISLYHSIATFAKRLKTTELVEIDMEANRKKAEKLAMNKLGFNLIKKQKFKFILRNARYTVKNRENLRFERTRLFGRVREIFLQIGFVLTSMNILEEKRDIFYLEIDEILFFIEGKSTTNNLKELIQIRKNEYESYEAKKPDERFYTYGAVNISNDMKKQEKSESSLDKNIEQKLKGIGASPGKVVGTVCVVKDPTNAKIKEGEILVAEYTDPGWIMLFPAASAILVERGSLLSHSAIVSRELGIPAIVGVSNLLSTVKSGDRVEIDGTTGEINVIENKE